MFKRIGTDKENQGDDFTEGEELTFAPDEEKEADDAPDD